MFIKCNLIVLLGCVVTFSSSASAQLADPWQTQYEGEHATGDHVIGLWQFLPGQELEDSSGNGHALTLQGASIQPKGKFGSALQSGLGWPVEDVRHAAIARNHPSLSPIGPFTVEMWIRPQPALEGYPDAYLIDKKYVSNDDYQFILGRADGRGERQFRVVLGFGEDSASFWSPGKIKAEAGQWYHVAFTYDAAGTVTFWVNGQNLGSDTSAGRGAIHAGGRDLSIGDRVGSHYHGFPGLIDQVRITRGVREFRPVLVSALTDRSAFLRMEPKQKLRYEVRNLSPQTLTGASLRLSLEGIAEQVVEVPPLPSGDATEIAYNLDTRLRAGEYTMRVSIELPRGEQAYDSSETFPITIVPRTTSQRMPVVMWGNPGVEGMATLKQIGFTHCLGLTADEGRIWEAGEAVQAVDDRRLASQQRMLDEALKHNVRVMASLSPGRWLESKEELLRIDREGKHYDRENITASLPELHEFAFNVGAAAAKTWGSHPAMDGALVGTEIRDGTQLSFHDHEREAFRDFAGFDIPDVVIHKRGVPYSQVEGISNDRIVPDDHPVYVFYKWFWKQGDGWNDFHSAVHTGLKSAERDDLWTFYDPAVRVPSVWGSGGTMDVISQWTYSYPDPIRIGLATDELRAMAAGAEHGQDVMKMTQLIWYRSQTAPAEKQAEASGEQAPWEDFDPTAQYISIAPMHLREAFWTKIARPIKGIMYHGWASLVPTDGTSSYRYTHPQTQHELTRLIHDVVVPLGPTLKQIPAAKSDVAMLESFASQIFAGRGTWGWGNRWTGDAWHVLQYAQLQPEIIYEETLIRDGLDDYKVLVMPSCDVLPASVVERVLRFQQRGGIVVGDARLAPAITPDVTMRIYNRTKQAEADKQELMTIASELRASLDSNYERYVDSSNPEVITHRRRYGSTDYIFVVNDRREAGSYVGHHGMVMENGLPAEAVLNVARDGGHIYDLVGRRQVSEDTASVDSFRLPVALGPADGGVFMVTERPIERVTIATPESVGAGDSVEVAVSISDDRGEAVDAVVPVEVRFFDPDGREAEFSGYYGARGGTLELMLDIAPNDVPGVWEVRARELATGITSRAHFRLAE